MKVKALTIRDGIIQDKFIGGIPVIIDIVQPFGKNNVRTRIPVDDPDSVTVHNTSNDRPTATDTAHALYFQKLEEADKKYVGAAIFVDCDSITQILPLNEAAFHTSNKIANRTSTSVEICENKDYEVAERNGMLVVAALLLTFGIRKVLSHKDWTGKPCPRRILNRPNGWNLFVSDVLEIVDESVVEQLDEMNDFEEAIMVYHNEIVSGLVEKIEELDVSKRKQDDRIEELESVNQRLLEALGGQDVST